MLKPIVYTIVTFLLPAVDLIENINKCYEIYCLFLPVFVTSKTVNLSVICSVSLRYFCCDTDKENNRMCGEEVVLLLV